MRSLVTVVVTALLMQQAVGDGTTDIVTKASNDFANKLYEKISKKPGNVLVCPISLHVALALVHQGASGATATQLGTVLRLAKADASIRESYRSVLSGIQDNTLKIATKLYPDLSYQLNKDYVQMAQTYFLSDVEGVDYSKNQEAAAKINKFVEEKTNNKIHNLISPDSITDLTKLIIINAVHFQASWKKTFPSAYDDYFRVTPQDRVKTKMMTQTDYFEYKEDPVLQAKVLKMDYAMGGYSMLFILPNKEDGLPTLESKLAETPLENILKDMREVKVEVTIPKFTLEQTHDLKDTLQQMGLTQVFSPSADLSRMAPGGQLYVSDVIQKTFINVHENGTEAAAATATFVETLSAANSDKKIFNARRPFHFLLIHSSDTSQVLFKGRLNQPKKLTEKENQETYDTTTATPQKNPNELPTIHQNQSPQNPDIPVGPEETDRLAFSGIISSNSFHSSNFHYVSRPQSVQPIWQQQPNQQQQVATQWKQPEPSKSQPIQTVNYQSQQLNVQAAQWGNQPQQYLQTTPSEYNKPLQFSSQPIQTVNYQSQQQNLQISQWENNKPQQPQLQPIQAAYSHPKRQNPQLSQQQYNIQPQKYTPRPTDYTGQGQKLIKNPQLTQQQYNIQPQQNTLNPTDYMGLGQNQNGPINQRFQNEYYYQYNNNYSYQYQFQYQSPELRKS